MSNTRRDLAFELFSRLRHRSVPHAERFEALFINQHPGWTHGPLPNLLQQMRAMNEFWRVQLGLLSRDTLYVRSCIVDDLEVEDWLRNFERYVMDTILVQTEIPNYQWPQLLA